MIDAIAAQADDALAWIAVVADPARRVDQAIEARLPLAGRVVLEVGPHAAAHAIRHASAARQVYAADSPEVRTPRGALPPNVSLMRWGDEGLPLRDGTIDVAILRAGIAGGWSPRLSHLLPEVERVTGPWGQVVAVHLATEGGELGRLIEAALGAELARERETQAADFFAGRAFIEERVEAVWQAPGRSILRRLLDSELAEAPNREAASGVLSASLDCVYRVHSRRQVP